MIVSSFVMIVPTVFAGDNTQIEEFTDQAKMAPASSVAGWGDDQVTLSRVDPTLLGTYDTPGWGYKHIVYGDFAYIADYVPNLVILNVSDPAAPTAAGVYSIGGSYTYSVDVDGNTAFLGEWGKIRAVDVSNPYNPTLISFKTVPNAYVMDIEIVGDWVFAAGYSQGLLALNITNPAAMGTLYSYNTPGYSYGLDIEGDVAYVADFYDVRAIDISDPSSMSQLSTFNPDPNSYVMAVDVEGDVLYLSTVRWFGGTNYLNVSSYDVSDPTNPLLLDTISKVNTNGWYSYDLEIDGDQGYVASYTNGFHLFAVSDPSAMMFLDSSYDTTGIVRSITKVGTELYVMAGSQGLMTFNVSSLIKPTAKDTYNSPGSVRDVRLQGNFAYLADDTSGLRILNITDPENIASEGSYNTLGTSYGVWIDGDRAYVADDNSGLQVLNVSDPSAPILDGTYNSPGNARDVMAVADIAYLADQSNGLQVVDVYDPTNPNQIGNYNTAGNANAVWVAGNTVYVADGINGLVSVNISDPTSPSLLDTYNTGGTAMDVQVDGDLAFVADGTGGVVILDVTDPSSMLLASNYNTYGSSEGLFVEGNLVFVGDDDEGLQILNITDPWSPTLEDNITTYVDAWAVAVAGNYSFVANRGTGLETVKVFTNVADIFEVESNAESTIMDTTPYLIVAANLTVNETKPVNTDIYYNITNDNGVTWNAITPDNLFYFPDFASTLRWKANLSTSDVTVSPSIDNVSIHYYYDDIEPISNATGGAPDYDNEGTIPVQWMAKDPFPGTGVKTVWLYFRYDSNYDGDFVDLGDISWTFTGLPGQGGGSGTFYFDPQGNDGNYEFYTRALDNASFFEAAPATADDNTMFDSVMPRSNCYGGAPTYANSGTVAVWYNSSDPSPGSGIKNISLYSRLDANNDGDFTDVGDSEWTDSGLAPKTKEAGSFAFNPQGKDGRYEFFTLANDNATNGEKYPPVRDDFTIFDSKAPKTQHYIGGNAMTSGWYIGSVYIFLSSEDATSGVNMTKYRVDGGTWTVYNAPFLLGTDGTHTIEYFSNDMALNDEQVQSFEVKIDNSAPETSFATDPASPGASGWFTSDVSVTLTGEDGQSGVDMTKYRLNRGNWNPYTAPFVMDTDGEYTVEFYSLDLATNKEEAGEFELRIDQTAPTVAHTLIGNPAANGVYPSQVTMMISATDLMSGLMSIEYMVDGGSWTPYSVPVVLSTDGNHSVDYRATDVAGNVASGSFSLAIDTMAPEVEMALDGSTVGNWYKSDVSVTVSATDAGGDIDEILVSVDRGVWQPYTSPMTVSDAGPHTVDAKAIDKVGHESPMASVGFKIDKDAPMTAENHAGTRGKGGWYITDVLMTLMASDSGSGVDTVSYNLDNTGIKAYAGAFTISEEGEHTVEFFSADAAGNKEVPRTVTIKIDKTPPEISFTSHSDMDVVSTSGVTLKGRTGSDVTLTLEGEATTVGADGTFSKALTLMEGSNVIRATGEDRAGHMTQAEMTLVLDTSAPVITIYSPSQGMRTNAKTVIIQGSTEPGSNVTINGETVTVDGSGTFSAEMDLQKGDNPFDIAATDAQGNENSISRDVSREKTTNGVETSASEAMPAFILALILVAVIVGILAFFMGRKMAARSIDSDDHIEPERRSRPRNPQIRSRRPPPMQHGSDLNSMESEGEFGAEETEYGR